MYCLMKPVLSKEEKQALYESLGYLDKETREKLIEVNQKSVDNNNYLTAELTNLILDALNHTPDTLKPYPIAINGHTCKELLINDSLHKFPRIFLANLDNEFGTYTNPPKAITLDLLDDTNEIDRQKLYKVKDELAPYTLSHELRHENQENLLRALGKFGVLSKQANLNYNFSELDAFNYQISNVIAVNFKKAMQNEITKSADKLTLQEIFYKVVNNLLNDINTRNPTTAPIFKMLSSSNKHKAYQYAYSQAKHSFVDWYKFYELQYEADRKALQSK